MPVRTSSSSSVQDLLKEMGPIELPIDDKDINKSTIIPMVQTKSKIIQDINQCIESIPDIEEYKPELKNMIVNFLKQKQKLKPKNIPTKQSVKLKKTVLLNNVELESNFNFHIKVFKEIYDYSFYNLIGYLYNLRGQYDIISIQVDVNNNLIVYNKYFYITPEKGIKIRSNNIIQQDVNKNIQVTETDKKYTKEEFIDIWFSLIIIHVLYDYDLNLIKEFINVNIIDSFTMNNNLLNDFLKQFGIRLSLARDTYNDVKNYLIHNIFNDKKQIYLTRQIECANNIKLSFYLTSKIKRQTNRIKTTQNESILQTIEYQQTDNRIEVLPEIFMEFNKDEVLFYTSYSYKFYYTSQSVNIDNTHKVKFGNIEDYYRSIIESMYVQTVFKLPYFKTFIKTRVIPELNKNVNCKNVEILYKLFEPDIDFKIKTRSYFLIFKENKDILYMLNNNEDSQKRNNQLTTYISIGGKKMIKKSRTQKKNGTL